MSTTPKGIVYPDAAGHTRLWEHFEALAQSADSAMSDAVVSTEGDTAGLGGSTGFTLANQAWTRVTGLQVDATIPTIGSSISNAGGILRVNVAGTYWVAAAVVFNPNATGGRAVGIDSNATSTAGYANRQHCYVAATAANGAYVKFANALNCQAGDYIRLWAYQSSGGALTIPNHAGTFIVATAM